MSGSEHKQQGSDELRDFLRKREHPETSGMDDFEREAMEGFAELSDQQILETSASLDRRMNQELLTSRRPVPFKRWLAAASVFLVLGIAGILLFNLSVEKDSGRVAQELKPVSEPNAAANVPPATEAPKEQALSESLETQTLVPGAKQKSTNLETMTKDAKENQAPSVTPNRYVKTVDPGAPVASNAEEDLAAAAADEAPVLLEKADQNVEKDKTTEENQSRMAMNTAASDKKGSKLPNSKNKAEAKPLAAAPVVAGNQSWIPCQYLNGESGFKDELKIKLSKSGVLLPFSASLMVNDQKKVMQVLFTDESTLNANSKAKVIECLMSMHDFVISEGSGEVYTYTFKFKP